MIPLRLSAPLRDSPSTNNECPDGRALAEGAIVGRIGGDEFETKGQTMTIPERIKIDETEYVRSDSVPPKPTGTRAVVVVDRGWVFAGDVARANGRILITRAVWVFRWESVGFDGVLRDPKSAKVQLRKLDTPVDLPDASEIFCVPVKDDWGL